MGLQESKEISCNIPGLQSCYSNQTKNPNQFRTVITDTQLRNSVLSNVIRKAYAKIDRLTSSQIFSVSNSLKGSIKNDLLISEQDEAVLKYKNHVKLYKDQRASLQGILNGEYSNQPYLSEKKQPSQGSTLQGSRSRPITQKNNLITSQKNLQKSSQVYKQHETQVDFDALLISLPNELLFTIIAFLINDYGNLIQVSSLWYLKIHQAVDSYSQHIDNTFIKAYIQFFSFKNAFSNYSNFALSQQNGFRLDRNILAEILPLNDNKIITIGYEFCYLGSKKLNVQQFKFIFQKSNFKQVWVCVDDSANNYDQEKTAFIQPILPFSTGDTFKISVNIFNLNGMVELNTLRWKKPIFEDINQKSIFSNNSIMKIPNYLNPPDADWILYQYCNQQNKTILDLFQPQLYLKECRCTGYGLVTSRMIYKAVGIGKVESLFKRLKLNVTIRSQQREITNQIKKMGLSSELDNSLELHQFDELWLYYIKGGKEF